MAVNPILKAFTGLLVTATLLLAGPANAEYPEKPVNYVIPFGPGGESDIAARYQQSVFKKLYGQDMVISYKPGGGGAVGWSQLNSLRGDGYHIMGVNLPHIIIKPLQSNVGFDTASMANIHMFHYTPDAIVVREDSPFETLEDLLDFARENPGKLLFSGSGKGTANHLAQVRFDELAGIKSTYIAFKGTGKAVAALLGEQVQAEWGYTSVGANHDGQVRLLAVATEERHPRFPDVPTFKELGYDLVSGAYRGIAVPQSVPEALRQQISDTIEAINQDPEFRQKMEQDGFALLDITYDKMDEFLQQKTREYTDTARRAGLIK